MLVEVLLQLLVGKVDVELLKPVHVEVLEAKDVQNANEREASVRPLDPGVDALQDPLEQVGIETHGCGVPGITSLREWRMVYMYTCESTSVGIDTIPPYSIYGVGNYMYVYRGQVACTREREAAERRRIQ